jgi:hypothetical protein
MKLKRDLTVGNGDGLGVFFPPAFPDLSRFSNGLFVLLNPDHIRKNERRSETRGSLKGSFKTISLEYQYIRTEKRNCAL